MLAITLTIIWAITFSLQKEENIDPENSQASTPSGVKYSMRDRFGVGGFPAPGNPLEMGWYFSWTPASPHIIGYYNRGVQFIPLVGLANETLAPDIHYPDQPGKTTCATWKEFFKSHPYEYNNDSYVMVGNEVGFGGETWTYDQATQFYVSWRNCIKSYNPKIKVGLGATPWTHGLTGNINGREYFINFINKLKTTYGNDLLPDFVVQHGYSYKGVLSEDIKASKNNIVDMRRVLNDLGLRDRDLIIKEVSPSNGQSYDQSIQYMDEVINFYASATDNQTGNSTDANRLVQRWAWFLSSEGEDTYSQNPTWRYYALFDETKSYAITPTGNKYKELINKYVNMDPKCRVQGYKIVDGSSNNASQFQNSVLTITGNGVNTTCNINPCIFNNLEGNKVYNISITAPTTFKPYSTYCFNKMDCHEATNFSRVDGNNRQIFCPAGGYADLWWGATYNQPSVTPSPAATPTPRVSPSPTPTPRTSPTPRVSPTPTPRISPTPRASSSPTPRVSPGISPSVTPRISPTTNPSIIVPSPSVTPIPSSNPITKDKVDLNSDTQINIADFALFISHYKAENCRIDFNSNGNCKDIEDFLIFVTEYRKYR